MRQLQELSKVFPEKFIHKNPTGFGDYIQHSVIRQRLLSVLGGYSQEVKHIIREKLTDKQGVEKEVITGVILALTVEVDGELVTIEEAGDVEQPFNWFTDGAISTTSLMFGGTEQDQFVSDSVETLTE